MMGWGWNGMGVDWRRRLGARKLDERYARGEIDRQEYLQRREDLSR